MNLSDITIIFIGLAIISTFIGILRDETWSKNPWLITVLAALLWGIVQEKN